MKSPEFKRQDNVNDPDAQAKHRKKLLELYELPANASNRQLDEEIKKDLRASLIADKKMEKSLEAFKKAADEGKADIIRGKTIDEEEWEGDLEKK